MKDCRIVKADCVGSSICILDTRMCQCVHVYLCLCVCVAVAVCVCVCDGYQYTGHIQYAFIQF